MSADRPKLSVVPSMETQELALSALALVAAEYEIPDLRKPCIAYLLDGNAGGAERHDQAWLVAVAMRDLGLSEKETGRVLDRWAKKICYPVHEARRPLKNAYAKTPSGGYRYHGPGLVKKPGTKAHTVLAQICADVGCPANCPAFQHVERGPKGQTFRHFERLGWPEALRRRRNGAAVDIYRAICDLEYARGFAAGTTLLTSTRQLADLAGRDRGHVLENLRVLHVAGLLRHLKRGSGSGPNAADRQPTEVARAVPIPTVPAALLPRYRTGSDSPPRIESDTPPQIEDESRPHIGGGS